VPSTVDVGRGILGFLGPLTGERATGKVLIVPPTGTVGSFLLGPNWWLAATINGALRPDFLYRVRPNYANEAGAWAIPPAGGLVDVESIVGGARWNLEPGTVMRWADGEIPAGFGPTGLEVGPDGLTGGSDDVDAHEVGSDRLKWAGMIEAVGNENTELELFRGSIAAFPAAVLVWGASAESPSFSGRGRQAYNERFELLVICDRADNEAGRRGEGLRLLDRMQDQVLWRQIAFDDESRGHGVVVSAIRGVNVETRYRLTLTKKEYSQFYIYGMRLAVARIATGKWSSTANPWKKSRIQAPTNETNFPTDPNPLEKADVTVKMENDD
jgi:hypothetical protein